jgi:3-hydroxybutyryl-CoA dehydrogenase
MTQPDKPPRAPLAPRTLGIAGSGNIACGLAVACAPHLEVRLHARSAESAARAQATMARMAGSAHDGVTVERRLSALEGCDLLVEAVAEDPDVKSAVLRELAALPGCAPLATTTSSLSVGELALASGAPDRFGALHVFSPVYRQPLVELAFPDTATDATRATLRAFCQAIGKTVVEVPDIPGFVVNRLLFPMLVSAVELLERTDLDAESIDDAMRLSVGHPLGPLRTLDFIGIDVSAAIAERLDLGVPRMMSEMIAAGRLGRKTRAGFYTYRP